MVIYQHLVILIVSNIIISMMIYILGNHQCTVSHYMIMRYFRCRSQIVGWRQTFDVEGMPYMCFICPKVQGS